MQNTTQLMTGGSFLTQDTAPQAIFIPEDFSEEQLMVKGMVMDFIQQHIAPRFDDLEKMDNALSKKLIEEMGELGIVGISFPEKYGGSDMDFITHILLSELMAHARSMSVSFSAHTGIGMLPILYFGTEAQKEKYLPDLVAGNKIAAYCLTEPGSGSDALAAKTSAVLSEDGQHYIMNGQKMWITNAGFADVFTVFAKIDGQHFTGFIVERDWDGVSFGAEEDKMGIKGSSTRQVFFENVKVPKENLLGKIGKGHRIAFNILNVGRLKLASGAVGGAKSAADYAIRYANERHQFKQAISNFGAIQHKIAEQAIRIWVNEAACYRSANDIQQMEHALLAQGKSYGEALLGAAEEFAIECALMKVHGSEMLDYVVDEGVQIYGGMGFSEEAPMAAAYRDSRINRIFEGTNEINRLLAIDRLLKKAMRGDLDLMNASLEIQKELGNSGSDKSINGQKFMAREKQMLKQMKKAFILLTGATVKELMQSLSTEQEILMNLSDMMAEIYLAESAILRTEKLHSRGEEASSYPASMTAVFLDDAMERFRFNGLRAISGWATGETKKQLTNSLQLLTQYEGINTKEARRFIAARLIEGNGYVL